MFVFDAETRTDATQRLTFGSYQFFEKGACLEEGLFHADDLSPEELHTLQQYAATHPANTGNSRHLQLRLLSLGQFRERLFQAAYKGRCLLVGFNLPFDLSRIACDFGVARGRFAGGFSLPICTYTDARGSEHVDRFRPRIGIKHIDGKRALKGFTGRNSPDREDMIPEGSRKGKPVQGYVFPGHLLDARTLAFALTDRGYSLEAACKAFGVEHGKQSTSRHGIVTPEYIDYNRRDVLATAELAVKLLEEFDLHPIDLQATQAYSPASIGKAYLRAMGIPPILERQPDFPARYLGYAQSAFFGGRTSAHIRKAPVPVVYTDFLSMYPTVNNLMGLWGLVTARQIRVVEHCQGEIQDFLNCLTPTDLFQPVTWRTLTAFVKIVPGGDILPSRAKYSAASGDWQVALNHLHASEEDQGLWFSLPDVVASVLLTGRVPTIVEAFRIKAVGKLPSLKPVKLRGMVEVDPGSQDFFKVVIEQRKRLASRADLSAADKDRLDKALKVLANSASYGIYAEMNRREADDKSLVLCHGIDAEPYTCRVAHPEVSGQYCFPPLASLITGAARLMLALLEHSVSEMGGTNVMEDTDSMAIVATQLGGQVACPGGSHRTPDGRESVKALSWKQVEQISERFAALSPYDRTAIPGSILKIEDDNFDPATGEQRQLHCLAISAKRYALFVKDNDGSPALLRKGINNKEDRWSEHGLGHLLNPTDPECEDREWIAQVWLNIIREALELPTQKLPFDGVPAVGRMTVSSPALMRPLAQFNEAKPYRDQIKPFNFLLTTQVQPLGHPTGSDPTRFHLIAPYESDPRKWNRMQWVDQYTGKRYRITTAGHHGNRQTARVKTYGDVLRAYEYHPESKYADANGSPCDKLTVGLLQRRHVQIDGIKFIGKESNRLEEVEEGLIQSAGDVYTEYPDTRRDEWQTKILPALNAISLSRLAALSGLSPSSLKEVRAGRSRPHPKNRTTLTAVVRELGLLRSFENAGSRARQRR